MSSNLRVNPAYYEFGLCWVEIFLQISIRVNFWLDPPRTRLTLIEPVVSWIDSPTHK